jgi:energy-coupling factor transporter transmembrane protein EcfT
LKAVSYQNGFIFTINSSWILPAKILFSSFLGILMILSTDMLSLSKSVSFLIGPIPFLKYFGISTVISLSALNVKMFSTTWNSKFKAVKSRSAVLSPKILPGLSISMITAALRHSEETALALESRNYTGEVKSAFSPMRLIDYIIIVYSITAFIYALLDFISLSRKLF